MEALNQFAFFSLIFFGALTIVGLVRPYLVLWWTEEHDRSTVIKVFGSLTLVFVLMYSISAAKLTDNGTNSTRQSEESSR
jgi:hypothetical protein